MSMEGGFKLRSNERNGEIHFTPIIILTHVSLNGCVINLTHTKPVGEGYLKFLTFVLIINLTFDK